MEPTQTTRSRNQTHGWSASRHSSLRAASLTRSPETATCRNILNLNATPVTSSVKRRKEIKIHPCSSEGQGLPTWRHWHSSLTVLTPSRKAVTVGITWTDDSYAQHCTTHTSLDPGNNPTRVDRERSWRGHGGRRPVRRWLADDGAGRWRTRGAEELRRTSGPGLTAKSRPVAL